MHCVILSIDDGRTGPLIAEALGRMQPADTVLLRWNTRAPPRVVFDAGVLRVDGFHLSAAVRVFVSGYVYENPIVPRENPHTDWSVWQYAHLAEQQTGSALDSLLRELERRGVETINPASAARTAYVRLQALRTLRRAGCPVPALLGTNEREAAEAWLAQHGALVWRPATGRAAWQRFTERQLEDVVGLDRPPVLLAPAPRGAWRKTWVFQGSALGAVELEAPQIRETGRLAGLTPCTPAHTEAAFGGLARLELLETLRPVDPPPAALLAAAASVLGTSWLQITHAEGAEGPLIYDFDPDPRLDWLPSGLAERLIAGLAARLAGLPAPEADLPPGGWLRPALFLRRMLHILHDIEESKYRA